jgi:ubiquinone/menaquinone biosynthesis C-methylase UbiE
MPGRPLIHRLYALSGPLRRRRMRAFLSRFPIGEILDVGGTAATWNGRARDVTVLNVSQPRAWEDKADRFVLGDARRLEFADRAFDIAYSNSVIEHLGTLADQTRAAAEIRRVGRSYWVQTPARTFPVEPHYLTPLVHWLPRGLRRRALPYTIWALITHPTSEFMDGMVAELRIVSKRELRAMFPDARIERERFLGLTKSWIAVREVMAKPGEEPSMQGRRA